MSMDSNTKLQLIYNTFVHCSDISNLGGYLKQNNTVDNIIMTLQLYVDKDIIDYQDLYNFLMTKQGIWSQYYNMLIKWFAEQSASLITEADLQYLIKKGMILDEKSSLYFTYCGILENISFDDISVHRAKDIFDYEQFVSYLSSKPLSEIIKPTSPDPEKDHILKENILSRIDEINDIDDVRIVRDCARIIGMTDQIIEWYETAIQRNKYYVLSSIIEDLSCSSEGIVLDNTHNIISIYERITNEPFELTDDKYMIYFAYFSAVHTHHLQSKYATKSCTKIYQIAYSYDTCAYMLYPPSKELAFLSARKKQMGEKHNELYKCKFSDLVLLEKEADDFKQWTQDVLTFYEQKVEN